MPPRSRKVTRRRIGFAEIGMGERLRWKRGGPLIAGRFTRARFNEETAVQSWPSWQAWVEAYARCRADFLQDCRAGRFPERVPASERVFAAYVAGGDDGADAEAANIAEEGREDVRRVYAAVDW